MGNNLNILFLVPSFPTVSETFIVNQIIELIKRGHEVTIFSTEKKELRVLSSNIEAFDLVNKTIYANIPLNPIKRIAQFFSIISRSKRSKRKKLLKTMDVRRYGLSVLTLSSFYKIAWLSQTEDNYDIVHAHFGFMCDYFFKAKACGFFQYSKLVTTFHGYDIHPAEEQKNKLRYKELLESNYPITVNTPYTKALILKLHKHYKNIHILPVSLDTEFFKPNELPKSNSSGTIKILFCGRLITFKGASRIPEIANILINEKKINNIEFNIIGSSDEKDDKELELLRALTYKYNLKKHINILGDKTQNEVIHIMDDADLYIMPGITNHNGRSENQGLVIQEAQSMKLPVVVTNAGGMKYGLIDKETGYIVDENDLMGFANKLETLIKDAGLRKKMGEAGRQFVIENYASKILVDKLENIYLSL